MKIFFIVPPNVHYIEPYAFVKADKSNTVRPSLGLLYVAAALRMSLGIEVRIIDANAEGLTLNDLGKSSGKRILTWSDSASLHLTC